MPTTGKSRIERKKAYWLEVHGDLLRRIPLSSTETYDYNQAYELVPKVLAAKPIVRCKARCTTDAIRLKKASTFGAQPPRKVYMYKDIERFYSFANNPGILILGCVDPEKRRRNYEFFKFEEGHVQEIGTLINRARAHPMCILVEEENSAAQYQSSQSSLVGESEMARDLNESRFEEQGKHSMEPSPTMANSRKIGDHNEVTSVGHTPGLLEQASHVVLTETEQTASQPTEYFIPKEDKTRNPIPTHLLSDPLFRTLCEHIDEKDVWAVDFKYVDNHPKHGSKVGQNGGTYLFVAHHKYPEHNAERDASTRNCDTDNTAETAFTVGYYGC